MANWTAEEDQTLRKMRKHHCSYWLIARKLDRTREEVVDRAHTLNLTRDGVSSGSMAYQFYERIRQSIFEDYMAGASWADCIAKYKLDPALSKIAAKWVGQKKFEARLLASVPRDTRGLTAKLMGDPLPGRSALDRRQHASAA